MDSIEFLLSIWSVQCRESEFVALSSKGSKWSDFTFPYNEHLADSLKKWFETQGGKDLYFCPLPFTGPKRSKLLVARSHFLWSDIDAADYSRSPPSILWRSSPGRHQGLWRLPKALPPEEAAEGSRSMAYYLGADKGGWDLTQVLRIPGTHNNKYPDKPVVTLLHFNNHILKKIPQRVIDKWRKSIPSKILKILEGPATVGKRSDILWHLEHELLDLGIPTKDTFAILRDSDWNKYRGRADEDERFEVELHKIQGDRKEKGAITRTENLVLKVETYANLMGKISTNPGWLIEHWWQRGSHGILAGQPKSFKSTIAMDMFFSVASGKPFLGEFKCHFGGPVIIVQNENSDHIMKDRWEKIALSKGEIGKVKTDSGSRLQIEWARNLPIFMINQTGFTLDDAANRVALEELIQELKPAAIQLDPLYLMFSGDVNSAQELNPILTWCLYIKQTYNCAIMLVHHYGKGTKEGQRSGQRMLGSTTLHGWVESALYVERQEDNEDTAIITLDREFRGAGGYEKVDLHLSQGAFGDPSYSARLVEHKSTEEDFSQQVLNALGNSTDLLSKSALAKLVGISRRHLDKVIEKMMADGSLSRKGERYGVAE